MAKSASDIVERALTLIDEQVTEFIESVSTEMSMTDMALEVLPEVCRDLIKELPYELKRYLAKATTSLAVDTLSDGEDQSSYFKQKVAVAAPSDFWELVAVRMKVWSRPVTDYISISDEAYVKQNNPFTRSGKQNPTVAISNASVNSDLRIELFSIEKGDSSVIEVFEYVSFDNVPDNSGNDWPDELFDEVTKALSAQLNLIKGRLEEASIRDTETMNAVEQH